MYCAPLAKLPLLAIALPFFLLTLIASVGAMLLLGGGMLLRGACRRQWSGQTARGAAAKCTSRCGPPRLLPVVMIAVLGGVLVSKVVKRPVDVPAAPATELSADEAERLLAEVTGERSRRRGLIPVTLPRQTSEDVPPTETKTGVTETIATEELVAETLPVVVFQRTEPNGRSVGTLPEWAAEASAVDFAATGLPGVIKTSQHATPEEAEKEALLQLRLGLAKTFAASQPSAAGWLPPEKVVLDAGMVARRAIERSEVTVGEFTEPIFRAYWDITRPEDLESRLFAAWRPEALKSRLLLVGGGIGLLTLLFGTLAAWLRIDDATGGKYRKQLGWGTAALWIASGLALAIVA